MDQHNFSDQHPNQDADQVSGQFWDQFSEQWQEILAGYALGALEPEEMLAVEAYLQDHPELSATVQRLEESVAGLAYTVPLIAAPPTSKAALLARVNADLRATTPPSPAVAPTAASSRVPRPFSAAPPTRPATSRPAQPRPRLQRRRLATTFDGFFDFATGWKLTTMGTAAALLFFVVTTVQLTGDLNRAAQRVATLDETLTNQSAELDQATAQLSRVAELQNAVAQLQAEKSQLEQATQQLVQQLQAEEQQISLLLTVSQVVALGGTEAAPQAQGTLFVGEDSLVLVLRGLQPLPSGQTYQLWLIPAENDPISAGLVQVSNEEAPILATDVQLTTSTFSAVGLSIEPAGGSDQPTGDIVLLGNRT